MAKSYLWLDGSTRLTPDPEWTEEEAVKRNLVPPRSSGDPAASEFSTSNPNFISQVFLNSMGSLRWDHPGLESR